MHKRSFTRLLIRTLAFPVILTLTAATLLWKTSSDVFHLVILLVVVGTWGIAGLLLGQRTEGGSVPEKTQEDILPMQIIAPNSPVMLYYVNLLSDFQRHCWSLDQQRQHALAIFARMSQHLGKAADLSKSTGILAANAMLAAARCGEVGRGFVTVSRDLSGISERSETDLQKLSNLVTRLHARIQLTPAIDQPLASQWIIAQVANSPMAWSPQPLQDLDEYLVFASHTVQEMQQRYQDDVRLDVRWLQLGDAVKRVLAELGDNLFNLRQAIEKVQAEWRILTISQPLTETQLAELKKYFDSFGEQSAELA